MMHEKGNINSMLRPFFLISLVMLCGCSGEVTEEAQAPLRQVKSILIAAGSDAYAQSFSGRVHSSLEVSYSFRVSGTLESLPVSVGDRVTKGAILAKLDPADYELEVERAQASVKSSQALSRNASSNYERVKRLYEAGNTSRNDLDNARANTDTAQASAQADRKALEIAKNNLSYTVLRSDDDCAVASVDPEVGENINAGTQVVFASCGEQLEVQLDIPESTIGAISQGMPAAITLPALPGNRYEGVVSKVGVTSVGNGTTFPVTVKFTAVGQNQLSPGLSADVSFSISRTSGGQSQGIVVPAFAIGEDESGRFAFIVQPQGDGLAKVKRTAVQTGNVVQNGIVVTSGLAPGVRLVTAGVSVLRDGMDVTYSDE